MGAGLITIPTLGHEFALPVNANNTKINMPANIKFFNKFLIFISNFLSVFLISEN